MKIKGRFGFKPNQFLNPAHGMVVQILRRKVRTRRQEEIRPVFPAVQRTQSDHEPSPEGDCSPPTGHTCSASLVPCVAEIHTEVLNPLLPPSSLSPIFLYHKVKHTGFNFSVKSS